MCHISKMCHISTKMCHIFRVHDKIHVRSLRACGLVSPHPLLLTLTKTGKHLRSGSSQQVHCTRPQALRSERHCACTVSMGAADTTSMYRAIGVPRPVPSCGPLRASDSRRCYWMVAGPPATSLLHAEAQTMISKRGPMIIVSKASKREEPTTVSHSARATTSRGIRVVSSHSRES